MRMTGGSYGLGICEAWGALVSSLDARVWLLTLDAFDVVVDLVVADRNDLSATWGITFSAFLYFIPGSLVLCWCD